MATNNNVMIANSMAVRSLSSEATRKTRPSAIATQILFGCNLRELEEVKAGMPRVAKVFSQIDVENKGYVTLEQIQAFAANH